MTGALVCVGIGLVVLLQHDLDRRLDRTAIQLEDLAQLPQGEYLKPALLGYQHVTADVLWLRMVQVLGKSRNTTADFEWLYHALDVITTLDPHYTYAFQVGGIALTELAHRADLSNRLLEKGIATNPTAWWLPFNVGYNYFFYLGDPPRAAEYMAQAARLPGCPAYVPGLATRMYAEAGNPDVAVAFLERMLQQTDDPGIRRGLETRLKQATIERDIRVLEAAVAAYRERQQRLPRALSDLLAEDLQTLPREPFGGEYRLDPSTGKVTSSTHPNRFRVYRPGEAGQNAI